MHYSPFDMNYTLHRNKLHRTLNAIDFVCFGFWVYVFRFHNQRTERNSGHLQLKCFSTALFSPIANSLQSKNWKFKTWLIRWKWKPNRNFNPHHKYALICKHVLGFGNCPSMFQAIILSYLQDCLSFYWIKSRFKHWRTIDDKFEFTNAFQGQPERNSIWNSYCKFSIKFE